MFCDYYLHRLKPLKPTLFFIIVNNSVRASKRTLLFTITKIIWLMLFKKLSPIRMRNKTHKHKMQSY
jgi:hypothetical protein